MTFLRNLFRAEPEATSVTIRVSVYVEADEDGSYHAFNPAFQGLHVDGRDEAEAVRNFADAVPAYLTSLVLHGDPLPVGCTITHQECQREVPEIPIGAFLRHVDLQWRSPQTSGVS